MIQIDNKTHWIMTQIKVKIGMIYFKEELKNQNNIILMSIKLT